MRSWLDVTGDGRADIVRAGERLSQDADTETWRLGTDTYRIEPSWHAGYPAYRITCLTDDVWAPPLDDCPF